MPDHGRPAMSKADLTYEHYLRDLAYTRAVATELRLRFLLARTRARLAMVKKVLP